MSYTNEHHAGELERLRAITAQCRLDMHEPDEQDIKAHVVGDHLDNAHGEQVRGDAVLGKYQEYVVVLRDDINGTSEAFNLATLIALARLAVIA